MDGWPVQKLRRYAANIDSIRAEELLIDGKGGTPERLRVLVRQATGDESLADRVCAEAVIAQERSKIHN